MTPAARLAEAMTRPSGKFDRAAILAIADRADVPESIARRAARGRPVSTCHHLRLSAACGHDPYTIGRTVEPFRLGRFNRFEFAAVMARYRNSSINCALRRYRRVTGHNIREAASAMSVSTRAVSDIENELPVAIETTLAACRYVGIHPFAFCKMFHVERQGNNRIEKVAA